ncbi:MAG: hypothetical protein PHS19_04995, partial [Eubacteriales bacterium]|nr:hypothetical protein [Eubacteriales bacterium]
DANGDSYGLDEPNGSSRYGRSIALTQKDGRDLLVLTGGNDGSTSLSDVYSSTNGLIWKPLNAGAFGIRHNHSMIAHNTTKLFLTGGNTNADLKMNDLWISKDGGDSWTEIPVLKKDSNTLFLINSNKENNSATVNDMSNNYAVSNASNRVKHKTSERRFSRSSLYFNGTNAYLTLDPTSTMNIGGDITIEFWMKQNDTEGSHHIIGQNYGTYTAWHLYTNGNNDFVFTVGKQSTYTNSNDGDSDSENGWDYETCTWTNSAITDNSWHHVALTKKETTYKLYIDGTSKGTCTNNYTISNNAENIYIGQTYTLEDNLSCQSWDRDCKLDMGFMGCWNWGAYYCTNWDYDDTETLKRFNGYIEEISISETNRYTSDFTPPDRYTPRTLQQMLSFKNNLFVLGGSDDSGNLNDVWSSSDEGVSWDKLTSSANWSARHGHSAVVFDGKMWVLGGLEGSNYLSDAWYSSNGSSWTCATNDWGYGGRAMAAAVTFTDPMDDTEKIWILGGSKSSSQRLSYNDVIYSSDGINWNKLDTSNNGWGNRDGLAAITFTNPEDEENKIWVFGGNDGSEVKNDIWILDYPNQGTILHNITLGSLGNSSEKALGNAKAKLSSDDEGLMFHCPGTNHCYVAKKNKGLFYVDGSDGTEYAPSFTITEDYGGEIIKESHIIDISSSTIDGSGTGNRYLYLLCNKGRLFRLKINDDGEPKGNIDLLSTSVVSEIEYKFNESHIHCKNGGNDEIYITGLNNHILVFRQDQKAGYACCTTTLK